MRAFTVFSDNIPLRISSSKSLNNTSTYSVSSSNIWPKDLFLSYCHWQYYFSAKFRTGIPFQHLLPVQMITTCYFFLFLFPPQPSSERTLTACSDHQKGLPGPCADDSHPRSASTASQLYGTSHAFSLAFRGPVKGSRCHVPDPP